MSPLDVEAAPPAAAKERVTIVPNQPSTLRKWGPALLAIAMVVIVNVSLLGPTGNSIPSLTQRHHAARELRAARTAAVLEMEVDFEEELQRGRDSVRSIRDV
eukprot:CAMPEP_0185812550 /NCGR_PEP_ID=MMETSP1322-20130828/9403_1 /TAXON_ID=265543 /ORGANISM="Minutocellus polymorphus, Strain RCC2270" /LENGTH=101 /DNA_ID=CAMNT_0028509093 /DNA_START=127 /DNA_END=429 /DNA_ORIENTATION=+